MAEERNIIISQADETVSKSQSLRELANWLEVLEREHPKLAADIWISPAVGIWNRDDVEKIPDWARALAPCNKYYFDTCIELSRYFGCVRFEVNINRSVVCERIVTGTRLVPQEVIPERIEEERVEEIVEWKCRPLLGIE